MPAAAQYPANNCPMRRVKCPCCPSEKGTTLPARDRGPRAVTPVDSGAPPGQACVRHSTFILKSRSLHEPLPIHMTNATRYKTERLEQPSSLAVTPQDAGACVTTMLCLGGVRHPVGFNSAYCLTTSICSCATFLPLTDAVNSL